MSPDAGSSSTTSPKTPASRPLPRRPTSPPLPPRKNAAGLPPTYLHHLRALLHQWLEQQSRPDDDGLPGMHTSGVGERKLWDAHRLAEVETAIWEGAVLPQKQQGKKGLLEMDWSTWAVGAMKRRKAWKLQKETNLDNSNTPGDEDVQKKSKNGAKGEGDAASQRGRLGVPISTTAPPSVTPSRASTRPPSIASEHRSQPGQARNSPALPDAEPKRDPSAGSEDEAEAREWCKVISALEGFQRLSFPKRDGWEVVNDKLPVPEPYRAVPGAFPQSSHFDHRAPSPIESTAAHGPTTQLDGSSLPGNDDLLKPVFSLHIAASPEDNVDASSSTLHLKGQTSLAEDASGSVGSNAGRSWFSSGGSSGRGWSEIMSGREVHNEPLKVEFIEGRFALPSYPTNEGHKRSRFLTISKVQPAKHVGHSRGSAMSSDVESTTSISDVEENLDADESSSTWSGTAKAGSHLRPDTSYTAIVGGAESDIPTEKPVRVVGGTIVVHGMKREDERRALESVTKVLLYTIQSMLFELELLDAFRIPREMDPGPLPPKPLQRSKTAQPHRHGSGELQRRGSARERGEKARGFFQRLGKDTRGVWDGLLGRRSSISHETATGSDIAQPPPGSAFSSLGLPTEPPTPKPDPALHSKASTHVISHATDRSLQTLARLDRLLPSTTPDLKFPMPPLLLRVQDEDRVRRQKAAQEMSNDANVGQSGLGIEGLRRQRSNSGSPVKDGVKGRAMGYRLGGDVRAGLGIFSNGISTFDGWMKLQRLDVLCCIVKEEANGDPMATEHTMLFSKPRYETYTFYDEENDETLDEFLTRSEAMDLATKGDDQASSSVECRWFLHTGKRVEVKMRALDEDQVESGEDVWVECRECGMTTGPRNLSEMAGGHSWAKFLELLLYGKTLVPPDLCPHRSCIYHLRSRSRIVDISVTSVPILDIRLPKLQVGPNVPKRKPGMTAALAAVEGITRREAVDKEVVACKDEIGAFFVSIEERIAILKRHLLSPEPSDNSTDVIAPDKLNALQALSAKFRVIEAGLYDTLTNTPPGQLNDARHEFSLAVKTVQGKLAEWQKTQSITEDFGGKLPALPSYASGSKVWALPGSAVLVREDEPSSVIAYTLSSLAYFAELGNAVKNAANTGEPSVSPKPSDAADTNEVWSVEVKRRDTPRDLLSLRTIAKKRSEASMVKPPAQLVMSLTPNQPSLELSLEQVEGKSQTSDRMGDLVRTISKATAQDPVLTAKARSPSMSESETNATPRLRLSPKTRRKSGDMSAPPSAFRATRSVSSTVSSMPITPTTSADTAATSKDGWSSVTSSFSSSFNQLLKLGSDVGESLGSIRMRGTDRTLSSLIGPLNMMSNMDNSLSNFDDRPHIQFTYTLGDRMKIGCTVYYATAFDSLRRRCAIDKSVIASLAETDKWDTSGGKSKASFFLTRDKRFIVKELVSKWNVSDTHAMLEIAPAYFEHLATTHNKATSLAKIVGFYSVKLHDFQANSKKTMDLLVMENLFYKQNVVQTYDLKGIEGRKVPKITAGCTLFDGEWLEGMSKAPILLHPHAKRILTEALTLDTRFLSSQSIMDYSLLLGLDTSKSELVVGLVDAIGSYNLFKTIESRSKLALTRGGDVTIIPPDQYRERFENALRGYFVACPDKWSKTGRRSGARVSETELPSIM